MSPSEGILNWDIVALLGINSLSGHWLIDWTVNLVAQNKLLNGTVFVAAYWYCWFGGGSDDTLKSRRVVLAGLASCLLAIVIARALADLLPFRVRPMLDPASGFQPPLFPVTDDYEAWSSFPSDKAAFVFALAVALYAAVPRLSIALVIYAAAVVCLPRIWLGIHFPLDILVGAALGALAAWLCETFISRRLLDRLVALAERRQALFYAAAFVVTIELAYLFDNVRRTARAVKALLGGSSFQLAVLLIAGAAGVVLVAGFGVKLAIDWRRSRRRESVEVADRPARSAKSTDAPVSPHRL
jgi:undecaprenyl-diphosphatase